MLLKEFVLPLPPSANHGYMPLKSGGRYKSNELKVFEGLASQVVGLWVPPTRTPLKVEIIAEVPAKLMHQIDLDGLLKFPIDRTVGTRRDCWVYECHAYKETGEGRVFVRISDR